MEANLPISHSQVYRVEFGRLLSFVWNCHVQLTSHNSKEQKDLRHFYTHDWSPRRRIPNYRARPLLGDTFQNQNSNIPEREKLAPLCGCPTGCSKDFSNDLFNLDLWRAWCNESYNLWKLVSKIVADTVQENSRVRELYHEMPMISFFITAAGRQLWNIFERESLAPLYGCPDACYLRFL